MPGIVTPLESDWTDLASKLDDMQAGGSTNQAIGVAHGWMTLTNSAPYSPGTVRPTPPGYLILLSDGLNTQNRWVARDGVRGHAGRRLDRRRLTRCAAPQTDGVIIYSLYLIHVNGGGQFHPAQNCATTSSKYYDLTSASQIAVAFADITKQITNVRVSKVSNENGFGRSWTRSC